MEPITIDTADANEKDPVVATLVMAFSTDPAARWVYPNAYEYLTHFPMFVQAFGGRAFECNSAHVTTDNAGAALWLPPNVQPDEDQLVDLLGRTAPKHIRDDVFGVFEQMGQYHPGEPHWYLPLIGVDLTFQNRGYGSALLRHALAAFDRDRLPAYLESSNPRNISLYERHGFERLATIQVGSSPPIVPMVRTPRIPSTP